MLTVDRNIKHVYGDYTLNMTFGEIANLLGVLLDGMGSFIVSARHYMGYVMNEMS